VVTPNQPGWQAASAALARLLAAAVEQPTPCQDAPAVWTDPASDREVAAALAGCAACPLRGPCAVFARLEQPREVILAGRYWPRPSAL